MSLDFPNRSRSYDESGQRVRFVGHDGMTQVAFAVDAAAISTADSAPDRAEADALAAFDAARSSILDVAREAYSQGRKNLYVLTSADFK